MKTYEFHADAGHGWLKVERAELVNLGIQGQISAYSYADGSFAYLEEDCDLEVFAVAKGWGRDINDLITEIDDGNQSRIRRFASFRA